jgi:hypothetical protein
LVLLSSTVQRLPGEVYARTSLSDALRTLQAAVVASYNVALLIVFKTEVAGNVRFSIIVLDLKRKAELFLSFVRNYNKLQELTRRAGQCL